jgi:hypothetical protein
MQHARQTVLDAPPPRRKRAHLRPAIQQDATSAVSPVRDLQEALEAAYADAAPEPVVAAWPGWARLSVIAAGAALSWAGVIGLARLL